MVLGMHKILVRGNKKAFMDRIQAHRTMSVCNLISCLLNLVRYCGGNIFFITNTEQSPRSAACGGLNMYFVEEIIGPYL